MAYNAIGGFPPQQLSFSRKNKSWRRKCVDFGDNHSLLHYHLTRKSVFAMKINYDLLNGKIHMSDLKLLLNPYDLEASFIPDNIQHYSVINSKLEVLRGEVWGVRGQGKIPGLQARTYAVSDEGVLPLISEDVPVVNYDAKGNSWRKVLGVDKGEVRTNDIVNQYFSKGAKRVHIDNVRDPGPNFVPISSKYRTGDKMLDYTILGIPQNDVIIAPNVIRKSLVGNNGDFSKLVKNNAFRAIIPLLAGYSLKKSLVE